MEQQDSQFQKGFNNGYILAKHQPELLDKIFSSLDQKDDYCNGLIAGKEELELEKVKDYFGSFGPNPEQKISKDKDLDFEKER